MLRAHVRVLGFASAIGLGLLMASAAGPALADEREPAKHVLLLSVDGLHQSDLAWYLEHRPGSALTKLVRDGVEFTNAQTPVPSDSFPGLIAQATGGNPSSTGVYYDDTFNHALLPAGTTNCAGVVPGVEVTYFEQLDRNPLALDAARAWPGSPPASCR